MAFEYSQEISNDYEKLFESENNYDVIIYAGENENIKEIYAHSLILSIRSQYFYKAFSNELVKIENGKFILKKSNISPQLFKIILRFIYCGKIDLKELQISEIFKLLIAANELNIQTLIPCIQEYLIKNEENFENFLLMEQNLIEILEIFYQHYESFKDLWNFFLEKICENPEILFISDEFLNLKAPLLEQILNRDDLNLNEINIWNNLLKWSLAQNPSISSDNTKWNKEEIQIMEKTLSQFISLIRFYHMTPEDFLDKIYPLKELLPKDLVNNLLTFYITPNRKTNIDIHPPRKPKQQIDSVIIKLKHFAIFSSWIDKKENLHYNSLNIPYKFQLLYRANRDGDTASEFHDKCDNKGATIVIAKITNSEHIIGGYNPLDWSGDGYKPTNDSFIFSFTNRNNLQTAKVGYDNGKYNQFSIYCDQIYGPTFGGGHDLGFQQYDTTDSVSNNPHSYHKIDISVDDDYIFYVEDYEVFQVIKNN